MDPKKTGWEGAGRTHPAQNKHQQRAPLKTEMKIRAPQMAGNLRISEQPPVSQEELCSMEVAGPKISNTANAKLRDSWFLDYNHQFL
jgi:hypothetical protein